MKEIQIPLHGYSIAADIYQGSENKIMLYLPGYTSSKASYVPLATKLTELTQFAALVIDYSGHGVSPFNLPELMPAQNFLEVIAAFDGLKEKYPDKEIYVIGTSYGGYLATQLTKYRVFKKLVLRVPALYHPEDFYKKWQDIDREETNNVYRRNKELVKDHPLLKRASQFTGRTLVMVHEFDEFVPKETTDAYIQCFKADTYLAEGFKHSFVDQLHETEKIAAYQQKIADWLKA